MAHSRGGNAGPMKAPMPHDNRLHSMTFGKHLKPSCCDQV